MTDDEFDCLMFESALLSGDLYLQLGDPASARSAFQDALAFAKLRARQAPGHHRQRDIAVILGKLGEVADCEGDRARARQAFRDAIERNERLVREEPRNPELWWDLSASCARLADFEQAEGRAAEARRAVAGARAAFVQALLERGLTFCEAVVQEQADAR